MQAKCQRTAYWSSDLLGFVGISLELDEVYQCIFSGNLRKMSSAAFKQLITLGGSGAGKDRLASRKANISCGDLEAKLVTTVNKAMSQRYVGLWSDFDPATTTTTGSNDGSRLLRGSDEH